MIKIFRASKRNLEKCKLEFRKEKRKQNELIKDIYVLSIVHYLKNKLEEKAEERKNKERKLKFESGIENIINESNKSEEIEVNYTHLHKLNFCGYLRNPTINVEERELEGICSLRSRYKNKKCNGTPHDALSCKHYKRMIKRTENISALSYILGR